MKPVFLQYERFDKWGNIRLANPVTKTGVKPGDRVMESPGNGFLPVVLFGTVVGMEMSFGKWLMVEVKWDCGSSWATNGDYLQRI